MSSLKTALSVFHKEGENETFDSACAAFNSYGGSLFFDAVFSR